MKQFYKDFDLISENDIPDCNSKGIYLRHKKTGLEIFHLLNDDIENLFAFAFRTPVEDSSGAPHIIEHSVFCGSEKYPLKEPFVNLMNQSLYTFLNAMTYPDKTVYPASSANQKDYFHLMDVYADAVFFPLLRKETFMQEAHHLEKDKDGKYSIQGVVYNEMKGNYSSFNSVAFDEQFKSVQQSSCYTYDSGGDPLEIAYFTHSQFLEFHKKYYSPTNCLLFLYGNISTKEQLDFIEKSFLTRLEKKHPRPKDSASYPVVNKNFLKMEKPSSTKKMINILASAPKSGGNNANVTLNFRYGSPCNIEDTMELGFLMQVLAGNDSSPLAKVLTESKLGERLISGFCAESLSQIAYFGLSGVKKSNINKVKNLIFSTLENLCKDGVLKKDVDAAILALDFSNREVIRSHGDPFALLLMDRALNAWCYGKEPASTIPYRSAFEKVKNELKHDKTYIQKRIRKIFLNNPNSSFVTVLPSTSFLKSREQKEKKIIQSLSKQKDSKTLQDENEKLKSYQTYKESEEESACLPRLKLQDLSPYAQKFKTEVSSCSGKNACDVPLFINREQTNGIVYVDVCFPIDTLPLSEYPYLSAFSTCALNTGWNGMSWDECSSLAALCCGDMSVRISSGIAFSEKKSKVENYVDRDWLIFSIKCTQEKTEESLSLLKDAISKMEFLDKKRIKTLLEETLNEMRSSIIPSGTRYALIRSASLFSYTGALEELLSGLSQFFILQKLADADISELQEHFSFILKTAIESGAVLHITSDNASLENALPVLKKFASELNLLPPCKKSIERDIQEKKIYALVKKQISGKFSKKEIFTAPSQVSYTAQVFKIESVSKSEMAARKVLCHYLQSSSLWEKIRVIGGAYGSSASCDYLTNVVSFSSYRDPLPFNSLNTFLSCVKEFSKMTLSDAEVEKAITGTYGTMTRPLSPYSRGYAGFRQKLYGLTDEEKDLRLQEILKVTKTSLKDAAIALIEGFSKKHSTVLCDSSLVKEEKVINLPI